MTDQETLFKSIVWNLYKEHIKKFSHAAVKGEPTIEEMKSTFLSILPECIIKVLGQEKTGMIVQFHHLDTYPAPELTGVMMVQEYLQKKYGGGKFKINFYHKTNFMSTKNYETSGPFIWKTMIKEDIR
ncbi:MAG: hypothetical protein HY200_00590 [Nitrospirae bacterium]|nr:hypothetical protein [Nitrospirota bacterium]MBI3593435.1 hypothetical protein [Nitrospirota bacterium]